MYHAYVLKSLQSDHYYTGCTSNIDRRLKEHNAGKCLWSKRYGPWKLHHIEEIDSRKEAFAREKYLKSHAGRDWLKKLNGPVA